MELEFFMPMRPPTATYQEKAVKIRNGKPVFYEPEKLKAARKLLMDSLAGHRPEEMLEGPLELLVKWCFLPAGSKDTGVVRWEGWKTGPPDTDNLNKLLKDCMTRTGYWHDDAQVCREIIEKHLASPPGIYIKVSGL